MTTSWIVRVARRRLSASWKLLLVVVVVAVLAATTVCTLGLLVSATEQGGTRAALAALPASESSLTVDEREVRGTLSAKQKEATTVISRVLGPAIPVTIATQAFTQPGAVDLGAPVPDASYFGEIPGIRSQAVLVSGSWPALGTASSAAIPIAIPQAGATAAGLQVGAHFQVRTDAQGEPLTVEVVGVYRATHPRARSGTATRSRVPGTSRPFRSRAARRLRVRTGSARWWSRLASWPRRRSRWTVPGSSSHRTSAT